MRSLGIFVGLVSLVLLEALATACSPTRYPGTSAGSFAITATLAENSCAPGFDPLETFTFYAELRRDDGVGYWRQEGGGIVNGSIGADGHFHFTSRITVDAYGPDPDLGTAGCSLYQTETIDGVLVEGTGTDASVTDADASLVDAGANDGGASDGGASTRASFSGENTVTITQTAGSNCALLLAVNGGDFPSFPCSARYTLTATAR